MAFAPIKHYRSILFIAVTLLTYSLLFELVFYGIYRLTGNGRYSRMVISKKLAAVRSIGSEEVLGVQAAQFQNQAMVTQDTVLHPYVGYVYDPQQNPEVNKFGWLGDVPVKKNHKETFTIGMTGGSFAESIYSLSGETFKSELRRLNPGLAAVDIHLINFSAAGYKQPQQLLALTYLLSLGHHFDLVINIDGFNEVVLPYVENRQLKVNPFYPRLWNFTASKSISKAALQKIAYIDSLRSERLRLAQFVDQSLLRHSVFTLLLWQILDSSFVSRLASENALLEKRLSVEDASYQRSGPEYGSDLSSSEYIDGLVNVWSMASAQMQKLSRENNFNYIHILQPNQYVRNSKQFSNEEKNFALTNDSLRDPNFPFKEAVELGYSLLQEEGGSMAPERFFDFTGIYRNLTQTVYIDTCCHVNKKGADYFAVQLAKLVEIGVQDIY